MDLTADQSTRIKKLIQDWINDPRMELETTFGVDGVVDSTTFLQIAQRLRAKGFKSNAQEDRLNIITPSNTRFTLEGLGILQSYCKDDTIANKSFTVMIKDRASANSNVDIVEYDLRFKMRREEQLSRDDPRVVAILKKWKRERKAFRLIRRWSFEGKGVRMDLSMVRQTVSVAVEPKEEGKQHGKPRTEFDWSSTFLEKNLLQQQPRYEVEVELIHDEYTSTPELALKTLISGVGEVLRAIQKNSLLLRKSVANAIRQEYQELIHDQKFRGVGPVTLETQNMTQKIDESIINVRNGFNVTDKADGLRTMGFVSSTGELYLVDQSLNIYRTGLQNKDCRLSLLDGEWVTLTKHQQPIHHFLLFDIYYAPDGEKVSDLPFATFKDEVRDVEAKSRYNALKDWFSLWNKNVTIVAKGITEANRLAIAIKDFYFAPSGDTIFTSGCSMVLDTERIYHTDGLILTSNSAPLPDTSGRFKYQFKWKPARENTVDFLVSFEKDVEFPSLDKIEITEDPVTLSTIQYKTIRLYVGGKKSKEEANPRQTILQQQPLLGENEKPSQYRPVLFHPIDYPDSMANTCYVPINTDPETYEDYTLTEDSKEPIRNNSIVEMRYDPRREPGWRWIPSRIRHDKTERLQRAISKAKEGGIKYSGMMNDENVANSVWNSIHDPVTESMIRTGNESPTEEEIKQMMPVSVNPEQESKADLIGVKYYERKAPKENMALVKGLQDFHNKYIKNEILLKHTLLGFNKSLVDLACGKAGDLYKWVTNHAGKVFGIDYAADNITNPVDGAYRRYMDFLREGRSRKPPKIAFAIGNSSKSVVDGSAGSTPEERDIMRSVFGRAEPEGPIPPYIQNEMAGAFRNGADVTACMFALHYFFENKTSLDGFIENVGNIVKPGGYFIGCCFDGQKVFELLQGLSRGETRSGSEQDVPIWSITKEYEADYLTDDDSSIGLGIEVNFISIGMTHKEYIVPFELLKKKLARIGLRLLNPQELAELHLSNSTNTFDQSYKMAEDESEKKQEKKFRFFMPDAVKQFSFLNRWFIFKRQGITEEELQAAASSAAVPANAINQHFNIGITKWNKSYARYSIVSSSAYSVLKPWEKKYVNDALKKWFPSNKTIKHIVDATAHIGVDTINLSNQFPLAVIDAFEVVPETYEALVKNIIKFEKQNRIRAHNQDVTTWEPTTMVDFLYVDPPWGGKNYEKEDSIDLFLQKEDNEHNESKNVNYLIDKWIETRRIKSIIMKAPKNFNKTYLSSKYTMEEEKVLNRQKEIAYTLLHIRAPDVRTDVTVEEAPRPVEQKDDEEKKNDRDLLTILRDPTKTFKEKDLFLFGPSVAIRDSLKAKGRPPLSLSFGPENAGRWLSLSAPFPIPDRDLKGKDGNPVLYPTMEHYMAAMKYQHASNHPELVIPLFSTSGNIHQKFVIKRREKRAVYGSGTPDDYKLLDEEISEVKNKLTREFMEKQRVAFDDSKWNRPIRNGDPLSMRDRILFDALTYRWERDDNFRKIVEEIRIQHRYPVYTVGSDSDKSEWSAKLEIAGPAKGRITGENRIGFMIMEIAKFT